MFPSVAHHADAPLLAAGDGKEHLRSAGKRLRHGSVARVVVRVPDDGGNVHAQLRGEEAEPVKVGTPRRVQRRDQGYVLDPALGGDEEHGAELPDIRLRGAPDIPLTTK